MGHQVDLRGHQVDRRGSLISMSMVGIGIGIVVAVRCDWVLVLWWLVGGSG